MPVLTTAQLEADLTEVRAMITTVLTNGQSITGPDGRNVTLPPLSELRAREKALQNQIDARSTTTSGGRTRADFT